MAGRPSWRATACSRTSRRVSGSKCWIRRSRLASTTDPALPPLEAAPPFDRTGSTFLEAVMLGVGDALRADPSRVRLRRGRRRQVRQRVPAAPAAARRSSAIASSTRRWPRAPCSASCVGAALAGQRPIGEMQFNDFVATGFNQLVNNAAKIRYRWGGSVPMVVRMPWGGLRHAGPYHSQNTEAWFYRTPGLKIVVPSTPADARALMASRGRGSRSGSLLRAHRALPRSAGQAGPCRRRRRRRFRSASRAASRRRRLWRSSRTAPTSTPRCASPSGWLPTASRRSVLDLRSLAPLDREAVLACRAPLQPGPHRPRGHAHRQHRREPRGHHPGRGLRIARRTDPHPRRARYAGSVLPAARRRLPSVRRRDRAERPAARGLLSSPNGLSIP